MSHITYLDATSFLDTSNSSFIAQSWSPPNHVAGDLIINWWYASSSTRPFDAGSGTGNTVLVNTSSTYGSLWIGYFVAAGTTDGGPAWSSTGGSGDVAWGSSVFRGVNIVSGPLDATTTTVSATATTIDVPDITTISQGAALVFVCGRPDGTSAVAPTGPLVNSTLQSVIDTTGGTSLKQSTALTGLTAGLAYVLDAGAPGAQSCDNFKSSGAAWASNISIGATIALRPTIPAETGGSVRNLLKIDGPTTGTAAFGALPADQDGTVGEVLAPDRDWYVRGINCICFRTGTPVDQVVWEIQTTSGGVPTGTVVATSNAYTIASSSVTNTQYFEFPNAVHLTSGTSYAFLIRRTGALDTTNRYGTQSVFNSVFPGGTRVSFRTSWTVSTTLDQQMTILGASFLGSGATPKTYQKTGNAASVFTGHGADAFTDADTGKAPSVFTGSGADAFTDADSGAGIAPFSGGGTTVWAQSKRGNATSERSGSGGDVWTLAKTGKTFSVRAGGGADEDTDIDTGKATTPFTGGGNHPAISKSYDKTGSGVVGP